MPEPPRIPRPFAEEGKRANIPDVTEKEGRASWGEGFPKVTATPLSKGGIPPKRADFNGVLYALSQAICWLQQGGVWTYDAHIDYEVGNVVFDGGWLYYCVADNGPSSVVISPLLDTGGSVWKKIILTEATPESPGYMSAEDKARLDSFITIPMGGEEEQILVRSETGYEWRNLATVQIKTNTRSDA